MIVFPPNVAAFQTTREGGASSGAYASFNLGFHTGDEPKQVALNRMRLGMLLQTDRLFFMDQVHGNSVQQIGPAADPLQIRSCDALITQESGFALCVMTADCLPLLLSDLQGRAVAAVHCGWRGLLAGVVANTVSAMRNLGCTELIAWMGPAIGPESYEVGSEVRQGFVAQNPDFASCFKVKAGERFLCNLYAITCSLLRAQGVRLITVCEYDTYTQPNLFYSYRRDKICGRQASVIMKKG